MSSTVRDASEAQDLLSFRPRVDPVLLGVLTSKLSAVSVEMAYTLRRTSRSLYVKEGGDFSASILSTGGQLLTIPTEGAGSAMFTIMDCAPMLAAVEDLGPGDMVIANDPYGTHGVATHLPDIQLVAPYYVQDRLVGYGWSFIHSSDIGGRVPSSTSPFNTDIYQDGLQLPPVRFVKRGRIDEEIEAIIRLNNRTPDANSSDFRAMKAALEAGHRRVAELVGRYGLEEYLAVQEDILNYSASRAAHVISELRPGTYRFQDYLDNDGLSAHPVRFSVAVTVTEQGRMHVDFSGTDPQVVSAFNIASAGKPNAMLLTRLLGLFMTYDPTIPLNGGLTRPVTVHAPRGTVVHAVRPAAVGVRHASAVRVNDALAGAFVAAAPQSQAAAGGGLIVPVVVAEEYGNDRIAKVLNSVKGGFGGAYGLDGLDGKDNGYISGVGTPIESAEAELDVQVLAYRLRPDSGGPGRWRGGMGRELVFRIDRDRTQVLGRGLERFTFRPWGVAGGRPGEPTELVVNAGREDERWYDKIDMLMLNRGDTVTIRTAGGGGYGDPFEREIDAVLADVTRGLVSTASAERDYGVALTRPDDSDRHLVDHEATSLLRAAPRRRAAGFEYDFGRERRAWEQVFSASWYDRFVHALFALEPSSRQHARATIFDQVLEQLPPGFPRAPATPEQLTRAARTAEHLVESMAR